MICHPSNSQTNSKKTYMLCTSIETEVDQFDLMTDAIMIQPLKV